MLNQTGKILFSIALLAIGLVFILKPVAVIKIVYLWPKLILPRPYDYLPPRSRLALELIDQDPEKLEEEFPGQVNSIRISGVISIIMFLLSSCMLLVG